MSRRASRNDATAGQLSLWTEEVLPRFVNGTAAPPSRPSRHEEAEASEPATSPLATSPGEARSKALPPKTSPARAVAASRKDSVARSERALAAIRSMLTSSTDKASTQASGFHLHRHAELP